jgi:hypothetical protein
MWVDYPGPMRLDLLSFFSMRGWYNTASGTSRQQRDHTVLPGASRYWLGYIEYIAKHCCFTSFIDSLLYSCCVNFQTNIIPAACCFFSFQNFFVSLVTLTIIEIYAMDVASNIYIAKLQT